MIASRRRTRPIYGFVRTAGTGRKWAEWGADRRSHAPLRRGLRRSGPGLRAAPGSSLVPRWNAHLQAGARWGSWPRRRDAAVHSLGVRWRRRKCVRRAGSRVGEAHRRRRSTPRAHAPRDAARSGARAEAMPRRRPRSPSSCRHSRRALRRRAPRGDRRHGHPSRAVSAGLDGTGARPNPSRCRPTVRALGDGRPGTRGSKRRSGRRVPGDSSKGARPAGCSRGHE